MKTHNFHDMLTVVKFTMRDIVNRKSFRISTAIIVVLIILGFNIPNFINSIDDGDFSDTILISDPEQALTAEINDIIDISVNYRKDHYKLELTQDNRDTIKEKINSDEVSSAIMIHRSDNTIFFDYYVKNLATAASETAIPEDLYTVANQIESVYVNNQINKLNLTKEQLESIRPAVFHNISQTEDQEIGGNIFVMMMLSCVLFFAIYFCAYQVSTSITVEKTSKIMETLVTSTSPRTIILGKTIGIATLPSRWRLSP